MVSHEAIYASIKALLDLDEYLSTMVKKNTNGSQVIVGPELPGAMVCPMIQVVIMTNNMNQSAMEVSEITLRVNVYTMHDANGRFDRKTSEPIIQQIKTLIHDAKLELDTGISYVIFVEGRDPEAIADLDHNNIYFEGMSCRMFAA
jgi:hypothetical protein